jgi:uncharacterized membrane protein
MFEHAETGVRAGVQWLQLGVEVLGALVIAAGIAVSLPGIVRHLLGRERGRFGTVRLSLARYLTLALELQLAADILATAVAPSWDSIGKLAAVAVIRTALNFFLIREMQEEERLGQSGPGDVPR